MEETGRAAEGEADNEAETMASGTEGGVMVFVFAWAVVVDVGDGW